MRRTEAQREAWAKLTANQRRLIAAERPDEIEREQADRRNILRHLEYRFGPMRVAGVPEAADDDPGPTVPRENHFACTLAEIGDAFGITENRVAQIILRALRKLRHPSRSRYLANFAESDPVAYRASLGGGAWLPYAEEIDPEKVRR